MSKHRVEIERSSAGHFDLTIDGIWEDSFPTVRAARSAADRIIARWEAYEQDSHWIN